MTRNGSKLNKLKLQRKRQHRRLQTKPRKQKKNAKLH